MGTQILVQYRGFPRPARIVVRIVLVIERSHVLPHLIDGIYACVCWNGATGYDLVTINNFNLFSKPDGNAGVGFKKHCCCPLRRVRKQSAHGLLHAGHVSSSTIPLRSRA